MRARLSKSKLMSWLQCPKRLWLQVNRPEVAQVSAQSEAGFARGHRVGKIAQRLFPGGQLIGYAVDLRQALRETASALAAPGDLTLFEPAFRHRDLLVRADVLERRRGTYRLVEVKASTEVKPYHPTDVGIQAWVIQGAGIPLAQTELAHVDTTFVYPGGGDYRGLFKHVEMTTELLPIQQQILQWIAEAQRTLTGPTPEIDVGPQCSDPYDCEFYAFCAPVEAEFPVEILPNSGKFVAALRAEGYADLRDVPEDRLASDTHRRIWRATVSGRPEFDSNAARKLAGLGFPCFFLDFESVMPPVPLWAGTRPYETTPMQWSCHRQDDDGQLTHRSYLETAGGDPRRPFAETLIDALGTAGTIFVYNAGFEGARLTALAEQLPDLGAQLMAIRARFFDLLPFTRTHYYHRDMRGSWSLKAVLPTIAPDLRYANLADVQSGDMVEPIYLEMIDSGTSASRRAELEAALLRYCERDTLALVRLVAFFADRVRAHPTDAGAGLR